MLTESDTSCVGGMTSQTISKLLSPQPQSRGAFAAAHASLNETLNHQLYAARLFCSLNVQMAWLLLGLQKCLCVLQWLL